MVQNKELRIEFSKGKLIKLLLFSIIFSAIGLWILIKDPTIGNSFFNHPIMKAVAGYGGILLGVAGTFTVLKRVSQNKPAIILSDEGITEHITIFRFGLIPWSDISGFQEQSFEAGPSSKQKFIAVYLNDIEKYSNREKNALKRKLIRMNINNYGTPIYLGSNNLKIKHHELFALIQKYYNSYGQ